MSIEERKPYTVLSDKDGFRVLTEGGHTILSCQNKSSAENYVALLNKAYCCGYKAGYRSGREVGRDGQ